MRWLLEGGRGRTPPLRVERGVCVIGRRGEGTLPYGRLGSWCGRDDVGIVPYGCTARGAVYRAVDAEGIPVMPG